MNLDQHADLYRRMKRAVSGNSTKATDLDRIMPKYDGDPRLLGLFLDRFNSDDPWQAVANTRLKRAVFRTPVELRESCEQIAVSESGHQLTDQLFVLAHSYDPTRIWTSGSTAITKIMEAFGSPEQNASFTAEGRRKINEKKRKQVVDAAEDYPQTLDEVLKDPERIDGIRSANDRRDIHRILELNEELRMRLKLLDRLQYGETTASPGEPGQYLLAEDRGGMFFGWFERQLDRLPTQIRDLVTTVRNPSVELDDQERSFMIGSLIAYAAIHKPVHADSIIGGYKKDLEFLMDVPGDHPVFLKDSRGKPDLTRIREILSKQEITLIKATEVFDAYPIDEVRLEYNQAYLGRYSSEFVPVIDQLKSLFMEDGKFIDDVLSNAVPIGRLKTSLHFAALTRDDFKHVQDVLRTKVIARTEDGFYKGIDMASFQNMVDGVVIAARKLKHFDDLLARCGITVSEGDQSALAERFKDHTFRGRHYDLVENVEAELGMTIPELKRRVNAKYYNHSDGWRKGTKDLDKELKYGLFDRRRLKDLNEGKGAVIPRAKALVPGNPELNTRAEFARSVAREYAHLGLIDGSITVPRSQNYHSPDEIRTMEALLAAQPELERIKAEQGSDLHRRMIDISEFSASGIFLRINLGDGQITLTEKRYREMGEEPVTSYGSIRVKDPAKLTVHIEGIKEGYVEGSKVSRDWRAKANYLTRVDSFSGRTTKTKLFEKAGVKASPALANSLSRLDGRYVYVHQEVIDAVNITYQSLDDALEIDETIIDKGKDDLNEGRLDSAYQVSVIGTSKKDAGRFRAKFGDEFNWTGKEWTTKLNQTLSKVEVANMTLRIREYNTQFDTSLKLNITNPYARA